MRRTAAQLFARSVDKPRGRILFIEDQVPLRRLGTGFVRSNDIVRTMAEMGYRVTIFPVIHKSFDLAAVYADLPDTVEVMHDRSLAGLGSFLASRRGSFDTIWIARTHNLDRVKPILERGGVDVLGGVRVVLDTEAIAATRDSLRRTLQGRAEPFDQSAAIGQELANAYFCQSIVAVNEPEARLLRDQGLSDVHVLGHVRDLALTPRPWTDRAGMLFVGAFAAPDSPNYDGLCWFVDEVLPLVELALGYETQLTVVGTMGEGVDLSRFHGHARVTLHGEVGDTTPLYDSSCFRGPHPIRRGCAVQGARSRFLRRAGRRDGTAAWTARLGKPARLAGRRAERPAGFCQRDYSLVPERRALDSYSARSCRTHPHPVRARGLSAGPGRHPGGIPLLTQTPTPALARTYSPTLIVPARNPPSQ
jgi:hypothetical protein